MGEQSALSFAGLLRHLRSEARLTQEELAQAAGLSPRSVSDLERGINKILLLLDDAVGHEQVRPLLPGTAGSLVLVTSRRRLTALDDAMVISLDILSPEESAALLARLAARSGLRADDAAVGKITGLCGYLPLAIGMLARQMRHHPA